MSKNNESPKEKKSIDSTVLASIIGGIVTIVVALIGFLANRQSNAPIQQATPAVIVITNTANSEPSAIVPANTTAPSEATLAPVTATFTAAPLLAIGEDWKTNCISALWTPYKPTNQPDTKDGCLETPVDIFYTTGGRLAFLYSGVVPSAEVHGLFGQLPASGTVKLNVNLQNVTTGEVLIGIFSKPDFNSGGALLVFPATNNVKKTKVVLKTMPNQSFFAQSNGPVESVDGIYDLFFSFDGGQVTVKVKGQQINLGSIPVLSSEKWLFIGYQLYNGSNFVKAEMFDLSITK